MLPDGYILAEAITGDYIDTGILSVSGLQIETLIYYIESAYRDACAIFGARNTNSNTSAGQVNVYQYASGYYFGYNNGRATITIPAIDVNGDDAGYLFVLNDNQISINHNCALTRTGNRTSASFTGTRNIYVGAVNNGGVADISPLGTKYFKISKNDVLLKSYIACQRLEDDVFGFYEEVNGEFIAGVNNSFTTRNGLISVLPTTNGVVVGDTGYIQNTTLKAYPDNDYAFAGWYRNGEIYSSDNPLSIEKKGIYVYSSLTLEARFEKKLNDIFDIRYKLFVQDRFISSETGVVNFYEMRVVSADINVDALQKTSSTIVVENIVNTLKIGMMAILYTPKGQRIFQGIVESYDSDTIICREALAYFDTPFLFHANTNLNLPIIQGITNMTTLNLQTVLVAYVRQLMLGLYNTDNWINESGSNKRFLLNGPEITNRDKYIDVNFPLISQANIENFEEFLFRMFQTFGVVVEVEFRMGRNIVNFMPVYNQNNIILANNNEDISNINVEIEYTDTTVLYVYNSSGTTFRDMLSLPDAETNISAGTIPAKETMVMTDDNMATLQAQYIGEYNFNHKITFDMAYPNKEFEFGELKLGQLIRFYIGSEMYESIITGYSYSIEQNIENIGIVKYTLGKARSNLTSKINLGKAK